MSLAIRALLLLAGTCLGCLAASSTIDAKDLTFGGTGSATELLRHLGATFGKETEFGVRVVPSLGSTGGLRALGDGVLDLAVSGRPLTPQEEAKGLSVAFTARTPFVIATSHPKPNGLKARDVIGAFSSQGATWRDGTPIRVVLRPRSESDTALMGELFPGLASAIETARRRPEVPVAATDQDNAEAAEQLPGSLVGSTLAQLMLEKRNLRRVPIDGVEPTFENLERGIYPYGKTLYFVVPAHPTAGVAGFLAFLRSPAGKAALRAAHTL